MLHGRRVLICGGAGFVGWHLARRLAARNDVTVFDSFQDGQSRRRPALAGTRLVDGDVRNAAAVLEAAKGQEIVFHLAAIVGVREVGLDAIRTMEVTLDGTRHVLDAAAEAGAERVIVSSTSELYGLHAHAPDEDDPTPIPAPRDGRWGYAAAKVAADHLALAFDRQGSVRTVVIRPFNIYGPQQAKGAIAEMIAGARRGPGIVVHGDGTQLRAYCHVDDLLDALEAVAVSPAALGEVFNIGNPGAAITVRDLADLIRRLTGTSYPILAETARAADVYERVPQVQKAARVLDWRPRIGLEEGIRLTLAASVA